MVWLPAVSPPAAYGPTAELVLVERRALHASGPATVYARPASMA
jgi:hypothetical protein